MFYLKTVRSIANDLSLFLGDLRSWCFKNKSQAAAYFRLHHATVGRYENPQSNVKAPVGYLASLAKLLIEKLEGSSEALDEEQELLGEVNLAILRCYPAQKPFQSWRELCDVAEAYLGKPSRQTRVDWGEALGTTGFLGREAELVQLEEWVITERCRLVGVLGLGGIGKTALATKVAHEVKGHFDVVIWRSLRNAPPIEEVRGLTTGQKASLLAVESC